jgi:hypothetical protein
VNNKDFHQATERAVKNPLGKDAQHILKSTAHYIQMSGKHVAFSPMERNDAMTSLCAITQRYGTPSVFLTVSPDDTHHPLTLRIAFPSTSNVKFPAKPEKFIEALINEDEEHDQVSISQLAIHKLVTESPHTSATVFKLIMEIYSVNYSEYHYHRQQKKLRHYQVEMRVCLGKSPRHFQ